MASYSYKELCYQIPEYINKAFVDEFKREPDGDPGYDGDYWTLAAMYVEDLIKQRDELLAALQGMIDIASDSQGVAGYHLNGEVAEWDEFEELQAACGAIAKAKVSAVNHFPGATKMVTV